MSQLKSRKKTLKQQPSRVGQLASRARDQSAPRALSAPTGLDALTGDVSGAVRRRRLLTSAVLAVAGLFAGRVCGPATAANAAVMSYAIAAVVATCGVAVPSLRSHVLDHLAAQQNQVQCYTQLHFGPLMSHTRITPMPPAMHRVTCPTLCSSSADADSCVQSDSCARFGA